MRIFTNPLPVLLPLCRLQHKTHLPAFYTFHNSRNFTAERSRSLQQQRATVQAQPRPQPILAPPKAPPTQPHTPAAVLYLARKLPEKYGSQKRKQAFINIHKTVIRQTSYSRVCRARAQCFGAIALAFLPARSQRCAGISHHRHRVSVRDRGTYTAGTANAAPVFELGRQISYFAAPVFVTVRLAAILKIYKRLVRKTKNLLNII